MVTEDRSRGQLILIGAITLAFIILGVVVIFNGVLYTETLSSGPSSQSATAAEATAFEVKEGVGCLLVFLEDNDSVNERINDFGKAYQNTSAHSSPVVKGITTNADDVTYDGDTVESVNVTITYDSNDLSYEQELTIDPNDFDRSSCGGANGA